MTARDKAAAFVRALWPDGPPGYLAVWTGQHNPTRWVAPGPDAADQVAELAVELGPTQDVYLGIGAQRTDLGPDHRGAADGVVAIPGVWLDLDIGDHGKGKRYPSTQAEALAFLDELPCRPSMVIDSGGGLHVYHLFRAPLEIASDAERAHASALLYGWQTFVRERMAAHGWNLDSTHDLARVLRVPGTFNRKTDTPRPVSSLWVEA